jgi:glutaredoxin
MLFAINLSFWRENMKTKATFYHAGCTVCLAAEQNIVPTIDRDRYDVEIVNLGEQGNRIDEAKSSGVQSVPVLVIDNQPFHINFGASLADLG